MAEEWEVWFSDAAVQDVLALATADQRRMKSQVAKLKRAPELGQALGNKYGTELAQLRKLRIGKLRLVYEIDHDAHRVAILVVRERDGARVYLVADGRYKEKRLQLMSQMD